MRLAQGVGVRHLEFLNNCCIVLARKKNIL
nr:MAG TPA: hypothetical protein [Caudoviricetes sp.]